MHTDKVKSLIMDGMKKYEITSVLVTLLSQSRGRLITQEKMNDYYNGKIQPHSNPTVDMLKTSVNEDLEELLEKLEIGEDLKQCVWSYFLPKLTKQEVKLVRLRDEDHLKTYSTYGLPEQDPDIDEKEMKLSKTKSKFLISNCFRWSFKLENHSADKAVPSNPEFSQPQIGLRKPCPNCNVFHRKTWDCHQC